MLVAYANQASTANINFYTCEFNIACMQAVENLRKPF